MVTLTCIRPTIYHASVSCLAESEAQADVLIGANGGASNFRQPRGTSFQQIPLGSSSLDMLESASAFHIVEKSEGSGQSQIRSAFKKDRYIPAGDGSDGGNIFLPRSEFGFSLFRASSDIQGEVLV